MDPIPKGIGYELPQGFKADVVTISHEHVDHNNVGFVTGKPRVLRGLTADKKGWTRVDEKVKDVSIRSVGVYHDDERGAARGLDTVFIFEVGGVRIAHLGDLGHVLNDEQLAAIGAVDVLLVPVGGTFTIDGLQGDAGGRAAAPAHHGDPDALQDGRGRRSRSWSRWRCSWTASERAPRDRRTRSRCRR